MGYPYGLRPGQVRYGAGDFENAVKAPCGQVHLPHGGLEQPLGRIVHLAELPNLHRARLTVGNDSLPFESLFLDLASPLYSLADLGRGLGLGGLHQLFVLDPWHLHE